MNNLITLKTINTTASGGVHLNILINDGGEKKDVGILYLSEKEHDLFVNTLQHGAINTDCLIKQES